VLAYLAALAIAGIILVVILRQPKKRSSQAGGGEYGGEEDFEAVDDPTAPGLRRRRRGEERVARPDANEQAEELGRAGEGGEEGDDGDALEARFDAGPMTERQLQKAIRKREKRELKEARAAAIKAGEDRKAELRAKRAEDEAIREEARLQKLEAEEREQAAKRAEEEALYKSWSGKISVEKKGSASIDDEDGDPSGLASFIAHIKERKIVLLEDLASEFRLQTVQVLSRINSLQAQGLLTGILDDRGKFLYITEEEMDRVAAVINERGRISVSELAGQCNALIEFPSH